MTTQRKKPSAEVEQAPEEERLSVADIEERVDEDPEQQVNFPDQPGHENSDEGLRED